MTEREILLKKISTYQFSILDLQIFLDTHPYDQQVLSQIKECKEKLLPLIEEYEEKYGPLRKEANTAINGSGLKILGRGITRRICNVCI